MSGASVAILPDEEVASWRPFVHWVLCLPHLVYTLALEVLSVAAALASATWVICTGRVPVRLTEFQVFAVRERVRTYSYFFVLRESYPPFARAVTAIEPGDDPQTHVDATGPIEVPRWAPLARLITVLPHVVVLVPIAVLLDLLYPAWMISVAVNGGWTDEMRGSIVRVEEWVAELLLYVTMASDKAPEFGFGSVSSAPARAPQAAIVLAPGSHVVSVATPLHAPSADEAAVSG